MSKRLSTYMLTTHVPEGKERAVTSVEDAMFVVMDALLRLVGKSQVVGRMDSRNNGCPVYDWFVTIDDSTIHLATLKHTEPDTEGSTS